MYIYNEILHNYKKSCILQLRTGGCHAKWVKRYRTSTRWSLTDNVACKETEKGIDNGQEKKKKKTCDSTYRTESAKKVGLEEQTRRNWETMMKRCGQYGGGWEALVWYV